MGRMVLLGGFEDGWFSQKRNGAKKKTEWGWMVLLGGVLRTDGSRKDAKAQRRRLNGAGWFCLAGFEDGWFSQRRKGVKKKTEWGGQGF